MRSITAPGVRVTAVVTAAVGVVMILAGCVGDPSEPAATQTPRPSVTEEVPAVAEPLALNPAGTATENLDYFTSIVEAFLTSAPDSQGRDIIDHLVSVGFDKSQMEVTADTTAVGLEADNIQFSVKINDSCLVGQYGNVGIHTMAAAVLATDTCLVGDTRAIDW